jgi:outer membrane protein assembly factor BamB
MDEGAGFIGYDGKLTDGLTFTDWDGFDLAIEGEAAHAADAAIEIANIDAVKGDVRFLNDHLAGGHDDGRVSHVGILEAGGARSNKHEKVLSPQTVGKLELKWAYQTGGPIVSSAAIVGGVVYFGSYDHNLYAVNSTTGHKLWSFQTGGYVNHSSR